MAESVVEGLVTEALLEAIDRNREAIAEKARAAGQWLRNQAEPAEGVELHAPDGSVHTGILVVERNEVKGTAVLAVCGHTSPELRFLVRYCINYWRRTLGIAVTVYFKRGDEGADINKLAAMPVTGRREDRALVCVRVLE